MTKSQVAALTLAIVARAAKSPDEPIVLDAGLMFSARLYVGKALEDRGWKWLGAWDYESPRGTRVSLAGQALVMP